MKTMKCSLALLLRSNLTRSLLALQSIVILTHLASLVAANSNQRDNWLQNIEDERPIVINSMHSGQLQNHQLQHQRPGSWRSSLRYQAQAQANSSSKYRDPPNEIAATAQQQPSQDFDSQAQLFSRGSNSAALNQTTRWPQSNIRHRPSSSTNFVQDAQAQIGGHKHSASEQAAKDYYGVSAAPYAFASSNHAGGQLHQQQQQQTNLVSSINNLHANTIEDSIISPTDNSMGPAMMVDNSNHHIATWMQSMRDNHHGQMRSRFNLSAANHHRGHSMISGHMSQRDALSGGVVPVGGNALLSDGHMKAKMGPPQPVPYDLVQQQQSNRAVRDSVSTTAAETVHSSSRRNSKFTRKSGFLELTESTTPLSEQALPKSKQTTVTPEAPAPTVTANQHAPGLSSAEGRRPPRPVASTTTTSAPITTTTSAKGLSKQTMQGNFSEELATGSGHVIALNETDLSVLSQKLAETKEADQKFSLGAINSGENKTNIEAGDKTQVGETHTWSHFGKRSSSLLATTNRRSQSEQFNSKDKQNEIMQVLENRHIVSAIKQQQKQKVSFSSAKLNSTLDEQESARNTSSRASRPTQMQMEAQNPSSVSESEAQQTLLVHNNHSPASSTSSGGFKSRSPVASRAANSTQKSATQKSGRRLFGAEMSSGGGADVSGSSSSERVLTQQDLFKARSWRSRLSQALLMQRTLAGVLRRWLSNGQQSSSSQQQQQHKLQQRHRPAQPQRQLVQQQQQQPSIGGAHAYQALLAHYQPPGGAMSSLTAGSSPAISLLSSALSSLASVNNNSNNNKHKPAQSGGSLVGAANMLDQLDLSPSTGNDLKPSLDTVRQPLRQHANKKIIDSFIDLPVSERRQQEPVQRRSDAPDEYDEGQKLAKLTRHKRHRSSKSISDWKQSAELEDEETETEAAELAPADDELEWRPNDKEHETGEEQEVEQNAPLRNGPLYFESASEADLDVGESHLASDGQEAADDQDGDLLAAADESEDEPSAVSFYAPDINLRPANSRRSELGVVSHSQAVAERTRKRTKPTRLAPIEVDEELDVSLVPDPRRRGSSSAPSQHRARPTTANKRRRPAQKKPVQVPHVGLRETATALSGAASGHRTSSVGQQKRHQVYVPQVNHVSDENEETDQSAMMSPMSSSINVMDLDPSMTRLAHNKLIVAKFRPKRYRDKLKPSPYQPSMASAELAARRSGSTVIGAPTAPSSGQQKQQSGNSTRFQTSNNLSAKKQSNSDQMPAVSSLTGAILGTQIMSNNHINDIINRWTRPVNSSSSPSSSSVLNKRTQLTSEPSGESGARLKEKLNKGAIAEQSGTSNSGDSDLNHRMATADSSATINGPLKIMSELHSLMPGLASGLAARFSFPSARSSSTSTTSTTTTSTTTPPPQSAGAQDSPTGEKQLFQSQTQTQNIQSSGSGSGNGYGGSKNDKFNFSLMSMNNRERINPLLFPTLSENQRQTTSNFNSTGPLKKAQSNTRQRVSTTLRPAANGSHSVYKVTTALAQSNGNVTSTTTTQSQLSTQKLTRRPSFGSFGSSTSTTSTTTSQSPTQTTETTTELTTSATPTAVTTTPTRSSSTVASSHPKATTSSSIQSGLVEEVGQILRSQHYQGPTTKRPLKRPQQTQTAEAVRLRNQYLSLVGSRNFTTLNGRVSSSTSSTANNNNNAAWMSAGGLLPGHITLATSGSFASTPMSSESEQPSDQTHAIEGAALEVNRYQVGGAQHESDESDPHSIVIMSDNHHDSGQMLRARRPVQVMPHATRVPALSMFYSSSQRPFQVANEQDEAAQIARKYLEEFVNGSRIRPSSMAARTSTPEPMQLASANQKQDSGESSNRRNAQAHESLVVSTNHGQRLNSSASWELARRYNSALQNQNQQQQQQQQQSAYNRANGAPAPDSNSGFLIGKLDDRAHELLLDIFDRDATYSHSLFSQLDNNNTKSELLRKAQQANQQRQQQQQQANKLISVDVNSHEQLNASSEATAASKKPNKTATSEIGGQQAQQESFAISQTQTVAESSTNKSPEATTSSLQLANEQSRPSEFADERSTTTLATTSIAQENYNSEQTPSYEQATSGGDALDSNNRASMRKNQAKIQAILMSIAKKNAQKAPARETVTTTTTEPLEDLDHSDQEQASSHYYSSATTVTALSTAPSATSSSLVSTTSPIESELTLADIQANELVSMPSNQDDQEQETTKFYAPMKFGAGTTSSGISESEHHSGSNKRYPNVETLSSSRQKINRPSAASLHSDSTPVGPASNSDSYISGSSSSSSTSYMTTPSMPYTSTSKLTESVAGDESLKKLIKNRVDSEAQRTRNALLSTVSPQTDAHQNALDSNSESSLESATTSEPDEATLDLRGRPTSSGEIMIDSGEPSDDMLEHYPSNSLAENNYQTHRRPTRPIIIRRKPRPPPTRRTSAAAHSDDEQAPSRIAIGPAQPPQEYEDLHPIRPTTLITKKKKRRRKPTRRPPVSLGEGHNQGADYNTIYEEVSNSSSVASGNNRQRRPTIVYKPGYLIRKRPAYLPMPPENIRFQSSVESYNKTANDNNRKGSFGLNRTPVNIILPIESVVNRKNQDIRTRPLTIIDPVTENPLDSLNETVVNPLGLTRIPETTIMHDKMVVTYKPGRPLPGSQSGFGTLGNGAESSYHQLQQQQQQQHNNRNPSNHKRRPDGEQKLSTTTSSSSSTMDYDNSTTSLPQLGGGTGGDTHLVSIEQMQQQQQMNGGQQSTRRPLDPSSSFPSSISSQKPDAGSTTPTYPGMIPHRPIIVINGLFDANNSSSHNPHSSHHLGQHLPAKPHRTTGHGSSSSHTLIESGSMTVVAHASHGQNNSISRPWHPPASGSSSANHQGNRFNTTSSSSSNATSQDFAGQDLAGSSSSNQTADSIVGPDDMANFGNPTSSASGSYQNHLQQQQQQNQHIGMPYLGPGGTLSGANHNRPNSQLRPYRWRVKKRPGSNGGSTNGYAYDYKPSSSVSSHVYRPLGGSLQSFFSFTTIVNLYDNILIFFARLRTFIISLMVMFLPPLALAASVANAMSS